MALKGPRSGRSIQSADSRRNMQENTVFVKRACTEHEPKGPRLAKPDSAQDGSA